MLEIVEEIGAAAGFAAVPGLAMLSALYVSQAREVKRLREWAGRAPERSGTSASAVPGSRRIGTRHVAVAIVGLLVLAAGITRLTGDQGRHNAGSAQANTKPKRPAVKPGNVTVSVLNGTTVPGLAAALSDQIAAAGFRKGTIDDYSDKRLADSVVQYAPGHREEAEAVSRSVGISRREPVTAGGRALAGDAPVIVIAGADKAP